MGQPISAESYLAGLPDLRYVPLQTIIWDTDMIFLIHLFFATEIDPKMFHIGPPHHGKQSLPFV